MTSLPAKNRVLTRSTPAGVWRGRVTRVVDGLVYVTVPRLSPGRQYGPAIVAQGPWSVHTGTANGHTHPPLIPLAPGDRVLVGFIEGNPDDLVVLARVPLPDDPLPPDPEVWHKPTFVGGWTEYDGLTYPVRYRKESDIVRLTGLLAPGANGTTAIELPEGYRPAFMAHRLGLNAAGPGNAHAVRVNTDGTVRLDGTALHGWWSLDGISFPLT